MGRMALLEVISVSLMILLQMDTGSAQSECGVQENPFRNIQDIVGGVNSNNSRWPWMVELELVVGNSAFLCGASAISPNWIVTAWHCLLPASPALTSIVGWSAFFGQQPSRVTLNPVEIIPHPLASEDSNDGSLFNDIALFRFSETIMFTEFIRPLCLPMQGVSVLLNSTCFAAGYGDIEFESTSPLPTILQEVQLPLVDIQTCRQNNTLNFPQGSLLLDDRHLCAGRPEGGIDTCQGDSGGPLMCRSSNGAWVLEGITSFGFQCANPNTPGVYARVSNFRDWIESVINPSTTTTVIDETTTVNDETTTVSDETTTVSDETTTVSDETTTVSGATTTQRTGNCRGGFIGFFKFRLFKLISRRFGRPSCVRGPFSNCC